MKICLVAHGYPPELVGGTENAVRGLAHGLVRAGHQVLVVAGSMQFEGGFRVSEDVEPEPSTGIPVAVRRIHRADLYFDHWQKSVSARVAEAFRKELEAFRPDVVHVHHWIRLTRDLVAVASQLGIPCAVTLHDLWTTCLIAFRVRPGEESLCEAPLQPSPCLGCAGSVPPRTPWVSQENLFLAFAQRKGDLLRELSLARAVIVPSTAHAATIARFLGIDTDTLALCVVPHGRDLEYKPVEPAPLPAARASAQEPLRLAAWGHIHPLKGTDLLLDALRLAGPGLELHLAGGEPDAAFAERVRRMAAGLDVHFHGPFDAGLLDAHPVAHAHLMVSATRADESWGLVVDEAAHLRMPMVLPRSGAFPERLEEGSGARFYAPRDPAALAQVLAELRDDPNAVQRLRDALPAPEAIAPPVADHVARMQQVYDQVVAQGAPEAGPADWWQARMQIAVEEAWDASLSRASAEELGFA